MKACVWLLFPFVLWGLACEIAIPKRLYCGDGSACPPGQTCNELEGLCYPPDYQAFDASTGTNQTAPEAEPPSACEFGATRCRESSFERCVDDGVWQALLLCEHGCHDADGCSDDCVPGSVRCDAAGARVERCSSTRVWTEQSACEFGCSDARCHACTPGARRCQDDGQQHQLSQHCSDVNP